MGIAGDTLPKRYVSPTLIARGGMGEVYRATDSVLGRTVAVKLLSERHARESESRARFKREAFAAARVSGSRNVVTVFDVGEHDGRPLIVMEYVDGGTVHERMQQSAVAREDALRWLEQAADALDRAHAAGVVHRDVKPANLLLDGDGNAHVSDFGIASTAGLETMTLPGTVLGTVGYLSPEQARGEAATPASDRYSLAVVAFELLTGRRPYLSDTATTEVLAHMHAPVPRATSLASGLPDAVDGVFERALAKNPADRPATCGELVEQLRRALASEPVSAVVEQPLSAVSESAPTRRLELRRTRAVRVSRRRAARPSMGALLALLLVLGAGAIAALLASGDDATREASQRPPARPAQETTTARAPNVVSSLDGAALNDRGYELMQDGEYERALPLFRRAVIALRGTGQLAEAYASYNLAYTRLALGQCEGVVGLLDRSERIQGYRSEIEELRARWQKRCGGGEYDEAADDGPGRSKSNGKGGGKGRGKDD